MTMKMRLATVDCKCERCGEIFVKSKLCNSKDEATRYEAWAQANCTICPACYSKQTADDLASIVDLPQLQGTDKQIKYAQDLRTKYVLRYKDTALPALLKTLADVANPETKAMLDAALEQKGQSYDDFFAEYLNAMKMEKLYLCLTCDNCRELLNALA